MIYCYGWLWILNYFSPKTFFQLKRPVTRNVGVKASGFSSWPHQNVKEIHPKITLVYCCYWDVVSPMSGESYDEGLQESDFDSNFGKRHLLLIYINNKFECSGFEKKGEIIKDDI